MAEAAAWTTVLTVVGSVVSGGLMGFLTARIKAREAIDAWNRSRSDVADTMTVDVLKEMVTAVASAGHSQSWLTWKAMYDPTRMTRDDIDRYDAKMHELIPTILGSQAALATLSPNSAATMVDVVRLILTEDGAIGVASAGQSGGDFSALAARYEAVSAANNEAMRLCTGIGAKVLKASAPS